MYSTGRLLKLRHTSSAPTAHDTEQTWACGLLNEDDKQKALRNEIASNAKVHWRPKLLALAQDLPGKPIPYWLPAAAVQHLVSPGRLADVGAQALVGLQTDDDFRFVRLAWEVVQRSIGVNSAWRYFAKGGEYSPYYDDIHLAVRWADDAHELKSFIEQRNSWTKRASSAGRYGESGLNLSRTNHKRVLTETASGRIRFQHSWSGHFVS